MSPRSRPPDDESRRATALRVEAGALAVHPEDHRAVRARLAFFPALASATPEQRRRWRWIGGTGSGRAVARPTLDEPVSVHCIARLRRTGSARPRRAPWSAP